MSPEPETERLVREILEGVEAGGATSLTSVLRKAIRLAELCNEPEYAVLFNLHLAGFPKAATGHWLPPRWDLTREPKWDPTEVALQDRSLDGGKVQTHPLEVMEDLLQSTRRDRARGYMPVDNFELELSIISVLNRIRIRVAEFATGLQKQLIMAQQAQAQTRTQSGDITSVSDTIFIGHGRSETWRMLKDLIQDRLKLPWDEFNREPPAGNTTKERLEDMLAKARFAFIVMTAEDEHPDGTMHARENVIHEAGLFQGRLGFERAILLVEEGCAEFSNIHGLTQIRFPKGNIMAASEEIRRTLEREGMLSAAQEQT